MASAQKVAEMWANLMAAYPAFTAGKPALVLEQSLKLYTRLLADVSDELLAAATYQHIASSKYWPTIAELREAAIQFIQPRHPPAIEAWAEVRQAIRRVGHYRPPPSFGDPLIDRAVRALGWEELCLSEEPEVDRAHFLRAYECLQQRERDEWRSIAAGMDSTRLLEPSTTSSSASLTSGNRQADRLEDSRTEG